jgi:hypothetical protein
VVTIAKDVDSRTRISGHNSEGHTFSHYYLFLPGFHNVHFVNFRPSASITWICRIQVHTNNPHVFFLTTIVIIHVFV